MQSETAFKVIIPARYQSSRFPGKPLRKILGKAMVLQVYERAMQSNADEVWIATDDERIYQAADAAGARVCMTATTHNTGTDRLMEVVAEKAWAAETIVVNVQGDEPLIPVSCINQVAKNLAANSVAVMATLAARADAKEYIDPNVVKVVFDKDGLALLFSRAPIPHVRDGDYSDKSASYRHIGIYAYRAEYLSTQR